jgi:2',3'-cyclic-nucleotide 2'-phosphodiesterase (5'-nucleotidase family)
VYDDVEDNKLYPFLVNSFMSNGGHGYTVLKENATNVVDMGKIAFSKF